MKKSAEQEFLLQVNRMSRESRRDSYLIYMQAIPAIAMFLFFLALMIIIATAPMPKFAENPAKKPLTTQTK